MRLGSTWRVALLCGLIAPSAAFAAELQENRGRWILDERGNATPPEGSRRGLQTSGLVWHRGLLWSVGDQRSRYPGHVLAIDPKSARLAAPPLRPKIAAELRERPGAQAFLARPNPDFEGIASLPGHDGRFLVAVEDKFPSIVEIEIEGTRSATLLQYTPINFNQLEPWRGDTNFRLEGILVHRDSVLLAYERAADRLPRLLVVPLQSARGGESAAPEVVDIDFAALGRPAHKPSARLNLNGLAMLPGAPSPTVVGLCRDQERLLIIDLHRRQVRRVVDLKLTDPSGQAVRWVSPEGVAAHGDTVWLVNDPDSVRGNYRLTGRDNADGHFAHYTPLLFAIPLHQLSGEQRR